MPEKRQTPGSRFPAFLSRTANVIAALADKLNKPGGTISQVLDGSGNPKYITIPNAQIQTDWTQADNTKLDYVKNKPSVVTWSTLTGKPTTVSGYGITDAQPLDPDLTAIAALVTTSFGRQFLTLSTMGDARTAIGCGPAIALTTTGTGAATYNSSTGALNIPTPVIPATILSGGSAATSAILLAGNTVDLTIPISPAFADTAYQAVANLTNAPVSLLGNVAVTIKTKNTNSVVVTLKNNALATLALGQVVETICIKTP